MGMIFLHDCLLSSFSIVSIVTLHQMSRASCQCIDNERGKLKWGGEGENTEECCRCKNEWQIYCFCLPFYCRLWLFMISINFLIRFELTLAHLMHFLLKWNCLSRLHSLYSANQHSPSTSLGCERVII